MFWTMIHEDIGCGKSVPVSCGHRDILPQFPFPEQPFPISLQIPDDPRSSWSPFLMNMFAFLAENAMPSPIIWTLLVKNQIPPLVPFRTGVDSGSEHAGLRLSKAETAHNSLPVKSCGLSLFYMSFLIRLSLTGYNENPWDLGPTLFPSPL